jgi:integrase
MIGLKNRRVVKKLPDPLTIDERDRILAYMTEHYDERVVAYFRFAFYTGIAAGGNDRVAV